MSMCVLSKQMYGPTYKPHMLHFKKEAHTHTKKECEEKKRRANLMHQLNELYRVVDVC